MKMVPYEAFARRCGAGDVVLLESYKLNPCLGKITLDVKFFMNRGTKASTAPSYSSGPSTPPSYSSRSSRNAECSNCKLLLGKKRFTGVLSYVLNGGEALIECGCDLIISACVKISSKVHPGRNSPFNHEKVWAILRQHAKWDAPEVAPVEITEDETGDFHATVNTDELFGADPRPRPPGKQRPGKKTKSDTSASTGGSQSSQFGKFVSHELRLKREAAEKAFEASKDKDETIKSLKELRFLALSTKDLSDDDAYWIERKKAQIKAKLRAEMPMEPNNEDDSDE
nr:hypothetical protein [Tanacetum cinerariifolium]